MTDGRRIDALFSRCVLCTHEFGDRDRLIGAYKWGDLLYANHEIDVGFFSGDCRPYWRHVDCTDPTLVRHNLRPAIDYCVRCEKKIQTDDLIQPVFAVTAGSAINPRDPTDKGMMLGNRIHFCHVECKDRRLDGGTSPLLVM